MSYDGSVESAQNLANRMRNQIEEKLGQVNEDFTVTDFSCSSTGYDYKYTLYICLGPSSKLEVQIIECDGQFTVGDLSIRAVC